MVTNKKLLVLIILALATLVGLISYGDLKGVGRRLAHFLSSHPIAALAFVCPNKVPTTETPTVDTGELDRHFLMVPL